MSWTYPVSVGNRCCNDYPRAVERASLTLATDNGMQFTSSRFLEPPIRLGISRRRTAFHHVRSTVDETLNAMLDAEADRLC